MNIKLIVIFIFFFNFHWLQAQSDKSKRVSPPAQAKAIIEGINVIIDYSQPSLKGRKFGTKEFHPYGHIWRNGANESSWIEVIKDIKINGVMLPMGKYGFFVIPNKDEWTLIFNSIWKSWGAYSYDESKDVMRVQAKVEVVDEFTEVYTIFLNEKGEASLNWGNTKVNFQFTK